MALVDKNNGNGEPLWVVRIGDGTHNFNDLPETAYALRSELSDYVNTLSAEISAKVKIENVPTDYINISRVDAETYHQIVAGGTADAKTIYIVSSDNINAFGERVINVGDAVNLSDAVNLKQLNAVESSLTSTISSISADLKDLIDDATGDASGLVGQISAELTGIISTTSSDITGIIDTVSSDLTGVVSTVSSDLTGTINTVSSDITGMVDYISGVVDTVSGDLYDLSGKFESLDESLSDYAIDVSALGRTGDVFKYQLMQGGQNVGQPIEVPYDVFVDKGEIRTAGDKKYLILTLNNATSSELSIETTDLVDVYTAVDSDTIDMDVNGYQISGFVKDNSITPEKLYQDGVFVFDCGNAAQN